MVDPTDLQAPVGVGFSYSDTKDYQCTDDRTASESRQALEAFYALFPEYKANKFYITVRRVGAVREAPRSFTSHLLRAR